MSNNVKFYGGWVFLASACASFGMILSSDRLVAGAVAFALIAIAVKP